MQIISIKIHILLRKEPERVEKITRAIAEKKARLKNRWNVKMPFYVTAFGFFFGEFFSAFYFSRDIIIKYLRNDKRSGKNTKCEMKN